MKSVILLLLILLPSFAGAESADTLLLINLEARLTSPENFMSEIIITTYNNGTPISGKTYSFFADTKTNQFLLICSSPAFENGFAYIKRKDRIWSYTPITRTFFASAGYDFLEGTVLRLEDILPRHYSKNYKIDDKSKTDTGGRPAIKLFLRATSASVPYDRITLWLDEESMLLLKEEAYDSELNLLRTIMYSEYMEKDGWYQPSTILISDALQGEITSLITIKQTILSVIPDYVFTRSFVEFITK